MYEKPEGYFIPVDEYDNYIRGRVKSELPHKNDSRECLLRNKFQKSIKFFQDFLFYIGKYGEIDPQSSNLSITEKKFVEIIKMVKILKNVDDCFQRIDALRSIGFNYVKSNRRITFYNNTFPDMFLGLILLSKSGNKKYGYTCFLLCDYRGIYNDFKINFNDTLFILNDKYKKIAVEMNEIMGRIDTKTKIKPLRNTQLGSCWKIQYLKKGKSVSTFHISINRIDFFINFNSTENISEMGYFLKNESIELYNWFFNHINARKCSCKNNKSVDIGGVKKRICGLMNRMEIYNPSRADLNEMKKIVRIFHFETL
jgi:hypothetical protein